jgi:hypothetical protein
MAPGGRGYQWPDRRRDLSARAAACRGIVELSAEFGIVASTAQKALAYLHDTGQVRTELGLGTLVADPK